jgi:TonB-linked SusC/RagA family outer membrane protein
MSQHSSRWCTLGALGMSMFLTVPVPAQHSPALLSASPQQTRPSERTPSPVDRSALETPVSLQMVDVSLEAALQAIAETSGVPISFSVDLIPGDRTVALNADRTPLGEVLRSVLQGTALEVWVSRGGQIVVRPRAVVHSSAVDPSDPASVPAPAAPAMIPRIVLSEQPGRSVDQQVGSIAGRVVEAATQRPLAGVSVAALNTGREATTDANGGFLLSGAPAGALLVQASRVGFGAQTLTVTVASGQTAVANFALTPQVVPLEEMVVIGYGVQRRGDLTGAVASVSPERLENVPVVSVAQAIQGAAPGIRVANARAGAEPEQAIEIRGRNSLTASVAPLIVLDGIPYPGSLADISTTDIESISILKDASSAAVYGSRGANGVILITTKRGSRGVNLSYDGYVGVQRVANMPQLMDGPQFAEFKCERARGGVPVVDAQGRFDLDACFAARILTPSEYELARAGQHTDWLQEATRPGRQHQHNLSLSGQEGGTRFFLSGSLLDVTGVARGDHFDRITLRVNVEQDVASWLQLGTSNQFGWTDRGGVPVKWGGDSGAYTLNPLTRAYNEDGSQTVYPWLENAFFANPLQALQYRNEDVQRRLFSSNFAAIRLPVEGLSYRLNAGIDVNAHGTRNYQPRTVAAALNLGRAELRDRSGRDWTVENLLRFDRSFGDHALDLTGLYSFQQGRSETYGFTTTGFPHDLTGAFRPDLGSDRSVHIPEFLESGMISQMGRVNYNYDGRYLLTATVRRDGASVFGAGNKWALFPSLGLGWNLSEEGFWPGGEAFNSLRVRVSHGRNGNQAIRPYQSLSALVSQFYVDGAGNVRPGFGYGWFDGSSLQSGGEFNVSRSGVIGNPNLKWETTTASNLGLDFGILSNRVSGSLEVYRSRTRDLLVSRSISPTHGLPSTLTNIGELQNQGMELQLSTVNLQVDRFRWVSDFNVSANRNKIVDLYGDGQHDLGSGWFIGHPIRTNFGFVHDGIWQVGEEQDAARFNQRPGDIRIRDVNGDGIINNDDRVIQHSQEPNYMAGLNNMFSLGNVSLSFFVYTVQGGMRNNSFYNIQGWVQNNQVRNGPVLEHWTATNGQNFVPANRPNANPSDRAAFYDDPSFIRLRDVTLAFTLPQSVRSTLRVGNMRMYATGTNLWTHTKWRGLDPELNQEIFATTGGPNGNPLERTVIFGINMGL